MAEYNFIDKKLIEDLLKRYGVSDEDVEQIYSDTSSTFIQHLKQLCQLYLKYLKLEDENSQKMAYALGANIIFNLRKFVAKKDIILQIGGTDSKGNNLRTMEKPITDVLKNVSNYNINNGELALSAIIEKYENLNKKINKQQSAVWKKILDASELSGGYKEEFDASKNLPSGQGAVNSRNSEHQTYQRHKIDTYIYYTYTNKTINQYYKIDKNHDYTFFNTGWLFQWFMQKWNNATLDEKELMINEKDHPLRFIIDKVDNVPGYKGGDYAVGKREFQAKYGNSRLITIKSIEKVMGSIIAFLDEYDKNKKGAKTKLAQELVELFHEKGDIVIDQVNNTYTKEAKTLINSLSKRLTN